MTRSAAFAVEGVLPEWAPIALLCSTLVLEAWDVYRDLRSPADPPPISAAECWAFCDGEQPARWGARECACSLAESSP